MFTYKRTAFSPYELYTVGTYDSGEWEPESDHSTESEAAKRVHYLNGGNDEGMSKQIAELTKFLRMVNECLDGGTPIEKDDPIHEIAKQLLK